MAVLSEKPFDSVRNTVKLAAFPREGGLRRVIFEILPRDYLQSLGLSKQDWAQHQGLMARSRQTMTFACKEVWVYLKSNQ